MLQDIEHGAVSALQGYMEQWYANGRNAAQRGFYSTRNHSTGWFKVPPAKPHHKSWYRMAVSFCTKIYSGMNPLWAATRPVMWARGGVGGPGRRAGSPSLAYSQATPVGAEGMPNEAAEHGACRVLHIKQ